MSSRGESERPSDKECPGEEDLSRFRFVFFMSGLLGGQGRRCGGDGVSGSWIRRPIGSLEPNLNDCPGKKITGAHQDSLGGDDKTRHILYNLLEITVA